MSLCLCVCRYGRVDVWVRETGRHRRRVHGCMDSVYGCIYGWIYGCMNLCMESRMHVCIYLCTYVMRACRQVCVSTYTDTYTYQYLYMYQIRWCIYCGRHNLDEPRSKLDTHGASFSCAAFRARSMRPFATTLPHRESLRLSARLH